jgi:hypothetical protein
MVITDTGGGTIDDSVISNDLNNISIVNRFKCPFCLNTYKSSTSKPYFNHINKKHPNISQIQPQFNSTYINDFYKFSNEDFCILHLNIRTLPKYLHELDTIAIT